MLRSDIRTRVRDYLDESVAEIWTDDQLNRYFIEELRSLPRKGVYKEAKYTDTTEQNERQYTVPSGTYKVEQVDKNEGTAANPHWSKIPGVDNYNGVIELPYSPGSNETIRIHVKKFFTEVEDDDTTLDIEDDKSEVLVWGIVVRAYRQLIGYYRNNQSWDAVTRPGEISLSVINNWLRDAKAEYNDLLKTYKTISRPRDIDLTS